MKDFTMYPLSPYWVKKAGIILTSIGLLFLALVTFFEGVRGLTSLDQARLLYIGGLVLAAGLACVIMSKERIDDERVQKIRASSYRISFAIILIFLFTLSGLNFEDTDKVRFGPLAVILFIESTFAIVFHLGLYSDSSWYYTDNDVRENYRKNRRFVIIYGLVAALLGFLVLIAILNS